MQCYAITAVKSRLESVFVHFVAIADAMHTLGKHNSFLVSSEIMSINKGLFTLTQIFGVNILPQTFNLNERLLMHHFTHKYSHAVNATDYFKDRCSNLFSFTLRRKLGKF